MNKLLTIKVYLGCNYLLRFVFAGFLLAFLLEASPLQAQERCRWIRTSAIAAPLDTLPVLPQSLRVQTDGVEVIYDAPTQQVRFKSTQGTLPDSIFVCYQTLSFPLTQVKSRRDPTKIDSSGFFADVNQEASLLNQSQGEREEIFSTDNIQKTGNITRGISFGNQQNVFVNSALNLQLEGQLSDEIRITAAISDQNVPFQPEGNTQQLQEFDRIYVQLQSKKTTFIVGDILMQNPASEFLRFYKNVQGGQIKVNYQPIDSLSQATSEAGVALAKGKFASTAITPIESVQGPYRLQGPNQERFIIIIANSEQVYIDGKLLQRGFNFDYVIDYNNAEITFNPNIVITQFTRIRVDFEYSERNYSRVNAYASHRQSFEKFDLFANYYSEADNPRRPLLLELSNENREELSLIGDNLEEAFINSVDSVGFIENTILYRRTDTTTVNGTFTDVYVYSTNPQEAFFQLNFTEVGFNSGNYILLENNINGRVFQWVAPVNGVPQGNFEPVQAVPTPTRRQMITAGGNYRLSEQLHFFAEAAFSERDLNRYSTLDDEDNNGFAYKVGVRLQDKNSFLPKYKWRGGADYEFNDRFFTPIDRYRSIEFNRDWNIPLDTLVETTGFNEHIANFNIGLQKDVQNQIDYRFTYRNRGTQADGWQQTLRVYQQISKLRLRTDAFWMQNQQTDPLLENRPQTADWQRFSADIAYTHPSFIPGYVYSFDRNSVRLTDTDSVTFSAMNFEEHKFYFQSGDSLSTQISLDYAIRFDNLPVEGSLERATEAQTTNVRISRAWDNRHQLALLGTYRQIQNRLATTNQNFEENLMTRLDWNSIFLGKAIRSELVFLTTTGRELRREFTYIQVATGEGTHTWRDDNGDGTQQLEEFYLAINTDEKNYIKVFTPTDEYIVAFSNDFNYRLNLQAPLSWRDQGFLKKAFSKFSSTSSIVIRKKITDDDITSRFNPFEAVEDSLLLSTQQSIRSVLFFNRSNPQYGWDIGYQRGEQKQLLTDGFETRDQEEWQLNTRLNLLQYWNLQITASQNELSNSSDFLLNRNYDLESYTISPSLSFQPQSDFRITASYLYADKKNLAETGETALWNQWGLEVRWNRLSKRNLIGSFRYINIDYEGDPNTPVGYELLEALQNGVNLTWSLNWQQRLANGLQLNLNYEGRRSPEQPIVHIGRMQVAVLF